MHTSTLVLLRPDTKSLWEAGADLLRPYRMVDDELKPDTKMDYWCVGGGNIKDEQSATQLGVATNPDLAANVCFVSRLPTDYLPGAIVTPDGEWNDLSDYGWRMIQGDSQHNAFAHERWKLEVRTILAAHADCIAVEFDTHR